MMIHRRRIIIWIITVAIIVRNNRQAFDCRRYGGHKG